jgi:putative ABC transport system permease protein
MGGWILPPTNGRLLDMIFEAFRLARQAIFRNALRAFLTVLGIVIGVGAVIAMVTIGNGTTEKVKADLQRLGSNLLVITPGQFGPGRASSDAKAFNARDVDALRSQLNRVQGVAPLSQKQVTLVAGSENRLATVRGVDNDYFIAQSWELQSGREFTDAELRGGRAVCVIGATVRRRLFAGVDAVARILRVNKVSCEVIGELAARGQSSFGTDQDDVVLVPLRMFQRRIAGNSDISMIYVSADMGAETSGVQRDIEYLLRERRSTAGKQDDFTVRDMQQIAETQAATTTVLTGLLAAVAGVSLLVGGIGIMNIMLVPVTERTREIGIRLAVGAVEAQVLAQFLVEAVTLSVFGGIVGALLGLALAWVASVALGIPYRIDATIIAIAFAFSALVGVTFGYFPARRAARMDPIEALRRE